MPTPSPTRFVARFGVLAAVLAIVFVLASCASDADSVDEEDVATDDQTDDAGATDDSSGAGEPVADPIDPELVQALGLSLTGADLSAGDVDCLVSTADGDTTLTAALGGPPSFTPELFTALAVATHECIDNNTLAASLLQLSGELEEAGQADFSMCVLEQLQDETHGDLRYVGLSAMRVGFPVPDAAIDTTTDAIGGCLSATGIGNQLAAGAEQASGFAIEVDRECLLEGIDETFIDALVPRLVTSDLSENPAEELLVSCSAAYDSGLATELPDDFVPWSGTGALAVVDPALRNAVYDGPPPMAIDTATSYEAVLTTSAGVIRIELFADQAPETVNNFVSLARDGYYDATVFHRVIDGFMAQAGDPTGTGSGGPGYTFADEQSGLTPVDRRGLLGMANSPQPDSNGSQFFITFAPAPHLDGEHAVFGEVIEGDDVLDAIERRDPENPRSRGEMLERVEIIEG